MNRSGSFSSATSSIYFAPPFVNGRYLAANIPGARFVPLESRCHLILEQDPVWPLYRDEILAFLET